MTSSKRTLPQNWTHATSYWADETVPDLTDLLQPVGIAFNDISESTLAIILAEPWSQEPEMIGVMATASIQQLASSLGKLKSDPSPESPQGIPPDFYDRAEAHATTVVDRVFLMARGLQK